MQLRNLGAHVALGLLAASASLIAHGDDTAFTMEIVDVFAISGHGTVMTGVVATGAIETGDTVCVPMSSGETLSRQVTGVEQFRKILDRAEAGQQVGILVSDVDPKQVEKGVALHSGCEPAAETPVED